MKNWETEILGELVSEGGGRIQTGPFGSQLHAADYVEDGIPCIMPANMKDNRLNLTGIVRIKPEDAQRLHRNIVQAGDIVYSRRGDVTQKALISEKEDGYFCGTGCLLLRPGSKIDPAFLTYYLSTKTYQSWIVGQAVGATMPNLNTGILQRVSFCAPPLAEQQKIAKVLSTLDAKIALNNRINAELEGMAKLLYDYWFVQFDFPCLPDDYPSSGAGKPTPSRQEGKFCLPSNYPSPGAGKPTPSKQEGKIAKIAAACNYRSVGGLPIPQKGKYFVYVLLCADDSFYIGMTDDLYRRWFEHKTGQGAKWTKAQTPIKVIHHEVFDSRSAAAEREKELKTGFGRKWLKREYAKLCSVRKKGGLPAHQSNLMQAGKMVFNPTLKREIPEGWEAKEITDIATTVSGGTPLSSNPDYYHGGKIPWINSGEVNQAVIIKGKNFITESGLKNSSAKMVPSNTVLMAMYGATAGRVSLLLQEASLNQAVCAIQPKNATYLNFIRQTLSDLYKHLVTMSSGSARDNLNQDMIRKVKFASPPLALLTDFENLASQNIRLLASNLKQNQELTELRDWLLPMLMNGQVTIK